MKEQVVSQFVRNWGVDEAAEAMLLQLRPDHLEETLTGFNPPAETSNINGRLYAFVKNVVNRTGHPSLAETLQQRGHPQAQMFNPASVGADDDILRFCRHWCIDQDATAALKKCPKAMQEDIMQAFNPPPGTNSFSGMLKSYIRRRGGEVLVRWTADMGPIRTDRFDVTKGGGGKGGWGGWGDGGDWRWNKLSQGFSPGGDFNEARRNLPDGPLRQDDLERFVALFNLDNQARQLLTSLPEDMRKEAVQDFDPPATSWNFSARLHTFVQRRLKEQGLEGVAPIPDRADREGEEEEDDEGPMPEGLADFLVRWELDARAEKLLRGLDQDTLDVVLPGFTLVGGTINRFEQLANWVKEVEDSKVGEMNVAKRARTS